MNFDKWELQWVGKKNIINPTDPNNDRDTAGQCIALARSFMANVIEISLSGMAYGAAKDYWTYRNKAPLNQYFDAIPYYDGMTFQKGDVFVMAATSSNKYGHIGVCFGDRVADKFHTFESNYNNSLTCEDRWRGFGGVLGILRPKDFLQSKIGTDEPTKPVKFGPLNTSLKITKVTTNKGYPVRTEPMGKDTVYWAKEGDYLAFDGTDPVSATFLADSYKWAKVRTYGGDIGYIQLDFEYMRVEV